jgi:hypothetical protein
MTNQQEKGQPPAFSTAPQPPINGRGPARYAVQFAAQVLVCTRRIIQPNRYPCPPATTRKLMTKITNICPAINGMPTMIHKRQCRMQLTTHRAEDVYLCTMSLWALIRCKMSKT